MHKRPYDGTSYCIYKIKRPSEKTSLCLIVLMPNPRISYNENERPYAETSVCIDKCKRPYAKTSLKITNILTSVSLNVLMPNNFYTLLCENVLN